MPSARSLSFCLPLLSLPVSSLLRSTLLALLLFISLPNSFFKAEQKSRPCSQHLVSSGLEVRIQCSYSCSQGSVPGRGAEFLLQATAGHDHPTATQHQNNLPNQLWGSFRNEGLNWDWHFHLPPHRLTPELPQLPDPPHSLKGAQGGIRGEALCSGKSGRTGLQLDIFRRFYEPNSCISCYPEKH